MSEGQSRRRPRFGQLGYGASRLRPTPPMPNGDTSQAVRDFLAYLWQETTDHSEQLTRIEDKLNRLLEALEDHQEWRRGVDRMRNRVPWMVAAALGSVSLGLAGVLAAQVLSRVGLA
jgi:hypothetical protein